MQSLFDGLSEQLLRGGVGRRHARRYVAELRDHLDDLIAEEREAGGGAGGLEARALARLGSAEALAGAMIARRELKAWSASAPVAAWLVAPSLALAGGAALAMAGVVAASTWIGSADGVVMFSNAVLPVGLGWALVALAVRQRSAPVWPIAGLVVLAAAGAALQVEVSLPSAAAHGEIDLAPTLASLPGLAGFAERVALNLALTLAPYIGLSLRRAAQTGAGRAA
ncbi:MAG TPA: hypothetical protein VGG29_14280 [Caulobacteraceae bacterium]|jgi:hypothetical protein